ncbi:MAG: hypothetical protein H6774_03785 [Pseudomonadales bacterium]|nr:hypothetical protein [Pseudomonadales bacterium]
MHNYELAQKIREAWQQDPRSSEYFDEGITPEVMGGAAQQEEIVLYSQADDFLISIIVLLLAEEKTRVADKYTVASENIFPDMSKKEVQKAIADIAGVIVFSTLEEKVNFMLALGYSLDDTRSDRVLAKMSSFVRVVNRALRGTRFRYPGRSLQRLGENRVRVQRPVRQNIKAEWTKRQLELGKAF